ncbi:hypothetical protein ONZ51_g5499 [Trametes cubensis]|uniref:BTB domain-containing protein n=1 Tax=Trametes cubensis TaxID=1111947 RepID=A0AAD7TV04_9APHY|nr:hypothetical protein ONZ51_g5499 [Trametes cubensis]
MDSTEWDSVLQYISDPGDFPSPQSERPVSEMAGISLHPQQFAPHSLTPPNPDKSTPSDSQDPTSHDLPENSVVSVSTTFHPGANLLSIPPDLILLSSDGVFFYVHTTRVLSASRNHFNDLVPPKPTKATLRDDLGPVVVLPDAATVLNVVMHTVYDISPTHYRPSLDTLVAAVDAMAIYGLSPKQYIAPSTPLYSMILSQAPVQPIVVYALAATHDLYDLAVPVSSHLLSFPLYCLTDDLATRRPEASVASAAPSPPAYRDL